MYDVTVKCDGFLRHKMMICSPEFLLSRGIQVFRIIQRPGNRVLVRPGVIPWRFNSGPNVAEAVNFALAGHKENLETIRDEDGKELYRFTVCELTVYIYVLTV